LLLMQTYTVWGFMYIGLYTYIFLHRGCQTDDLLRTQFACLSMLIDRNIVKYLAEYHYYCHCCAPAAPSTYSDIAYRPIYSSAKILVTKSSLYHPLSFPQQNNFDPIGCACRRLSRNSADFMPATNRILSATNGASHTTCAN
jgi:hypothetical protein